jgi:serine/threonine protein kinase
MATINRPRSTSTSSRPSSRNYKGGQPSTSGKHQAPPAGRNSNIHNDGKRQIVGQYMLGKTIGEGTFGKVKLAVHMPSGEKVTFLKFVAFL